jgi:hypothetical protein
MVGEWRDVDMFGSMTERCVAPAHEEAGDGAARTPRVEQKTHAARRALTGTSARVLSAIGTGP